MERYRNFEIASYMYAYYAADTTAEQLRRDVETYLRYLPLTKVYLENHRGMTDIPKERLKQIKSILESYGLSVSCGITSTVLVDETQKPALFDTFCCTDPAHRKEYLRIVRDAAEVFDEIILDDYFFSSCRCEMCISAKGPRSWKTFRREQMKDFSEAIVSEAHRINPDLKFVIKYPNWYESYQETGYDPGIQKNLFDGIYTGTESRDPFHMSQHLQRYLSYSAVRLLENASPGRNGGGWIDLGGSSDNSNVFLEQAAFTLLAGAKELTLFNFPDLLNHLPVLAAMDPVLRRIDRFLDTAGKPQGTPVFIPFDAEGEDQLCNYLGMCGAALELTPEFPDSAPSLILTERAACVPDIMETLEAYVRNGGRAVVTAGFVKKCGSGINDMTSVRLTDRHMSGKHYMIDICDYDYADIRYAEGTETVMTGILDYRTNATWADILLLEREYNTPLLTEDFYGNGRLLILNVPDNFADLYRLPAAVIGTINRELSAGQPCYIQADPKVSLILYDNDVLCLHSFRKAGSVIRLIVRGEDGKSCILSDLETGETFDRPAALQKPRKRGDAALTRKAPDEYAFDVPAGPGEMRFLKIVRKHP